MQNLYDLLRNLQDQARRNSPGAAPLGAGNKTYVLLSPEDIEFLNQYLQAPGHEIHFKARPTGKILEDGEPEFASDWAIKGDPLNIFCLLSEAMMQNPGFADIALNAAMFFLEHVPKCETCREAVNNARALVAAGQVNWKFNPHKPK